MFAHNQGKKSQAFFKVLSGCLSQGFSLMELVVVIAILGVLSAIAIFQYSNYKMSLMKSASRFELSEMKKHLDYAHSIDGGYHQKIFTAGYRPSLILQVGAGFNYNRENDPICCPDYRTKCDIGNTNDCDEYFTLTDHVFDKTKRDSAVKAGEICDSGVCTKIDKHWVAGGLAPHGNSSGNSECQVFTTSSTTLGGEAKCNCHTFIVSSAFERQDNSSDHFSVFINQEGLICEAEGEGSTPLKKSSKQ